MTSNLLTKRVVTGFLTIAILLPFSTQAQIRMPEREKRMSSSTAAFSCDAIDTMQTNVLAKVGERAASAGANRTGRSTDFTAAKEQRLTTIAVKRAEYDTARQSRYDTMRTKAITETQKAAVETFIDAAEDLVDIRQAAIDAAITTFETDVSALKTDASNAVADLKSSVEADMNTVFADAKEACDGDSTPAEIRAIIKTGMDVMKTNQQTKRKENTFRPKFEALRQTRMAGEKAAIAAFEAEIKNATAVLKAAFKTP